MTNQEIGGFCETGSFRPGEIAFDIDGVVADTMAVFVRFARERYGLMSLGKEDLRCFNLYECLDLEREIIDDLICLTLSDESTLETPPMPGAPEVLTELAQYGPLRFVTARIWPESVTEWLHRILPDVPAERIEVIATGKPEAKLQILSDLKIRCFLEDRVETCRILAENGIQPLVMDQPWNRGVDLFPRLENWSRLVEWVAFPNPQRATHTK